MKSLSFSHVPNKVDAAAGIRCTCPGTPKLVGGAPREALKILEQFIQLEGVADGVHDSVL
jgi:hypothetical protein